MSTSISTTMTTKVCSSCGEDKPLEEFDSNGKRARCRECRVLYEKKPNNAEKLVEVPEVKWPADADGRLKIAVELRMEAYKYRAIDAIFDLAMMPANENPLMMQVKLTAASKLAGPLPGDAAVIAAGAKPQMDLDPFLKQLSEDYKATRPKLREIRERVAVFEDVSEPADAPRPAVQTESTLLPAPQS